MKLLNDTFISLGMLLTVMFCLSGCGGSTRELGPTVEISGKVTLDGEPVTVGVVYFENTQRGKAGNANLTAEGNYSFELKDTEAGEVYTVYIGGVEAKEGEVDADGNPPATKEPDIPLKFKRPNSSGLTAKITDQPEQTFNFELKSEEK